MTAYLMVKADVEEANRAEFDRWYETEHLPQARAAFHAISARRGWSAVTPGTHYAVYEFSDLDAAQAILNSEALREMVAEFDRVWQGRITRTRDVFGLEQLIVAGQLL